MGIDIGTHDLAHKIKWFGPESSPIDTLLFTLGGFHILRKPVWGGGGVCEMLTFSYVGGGGSNQMLM